MFASPQQTIQGGSTQAALKGHLPCMYLAHDELESGSITIIIIIVVVVVTFLVCVQGKRQSAGQT